MLNRLFSQWPLFDQEEANAVCDVLLSNTLRETPKKGTLPTYTGMGSDKRFKGTPTKPTFNTMR